jgi:hypothetical protein
LRREIHSLPYRGPRDYRHSDARRSAKSELLKQFFNGSSTDPGTPKRTFFRFVSALLQELIDRSLLPKFVVDVIENTLEQNATRVADWLEATGGLTAPEKSDFFPRACG